VKLVKIYLKISPNLLVIPNYFLNCWSDWDYKKALCRFVTICSKSWIMIRVRAFLDNSNFLQIPNANLAFLIEQKKLTDNPEQKNVTYIGIERVIWDLSIGINLIPLTNWLPYTWFHSAVPTVKKW